jgi:tRNA(Arg) A34 adenosine deaminase TadA
MIQIKMLSRQEEKFIATASYYATLSPMNNHHGCIVVLNGQEIGAGYNNYRNYSRDKIISDCLSCHAEISAVRNAIKSEPNQRKIKKMKLYVVRLNDQGKYLDSKPCYNCHCRLSSLGIRSVIYSTGDDFINMDLRRHCSGNVSTGYRYLRSL